MKKKVMKCIHPRKMVKIMERFIYLAGNEKCELHRADSFGTYAFNEKFIIDYNSKQLPYCSDFFTKNFHRRSPVSKGFAGVTISLLHELGHRKTNDQFDIDYPDWDRRLEVIRLRKKYHFFGNPTEHDIEQANEEYFTWPDEAMATEWAMDWLNDPANRKIAKKFEKEFFACFVAVK